MKQASMNKQAWIPLLLGAAKLIAGSAVASAGLSAFDGYMRGRAAKNTPPPPPPQSAFSHAAPWLLGGGALGLGGLLAYKGYQETKQRNEDTKKREKRMRQMMEWQQQQQMPQLANKFEPQRLQQANSGSYSMPA
jgi:uncharacterized membrane protein YebE (DUF533 family)